MSYLNVFSNFTLDKFVPSKDLLLIFLYANVNLFDYFLPETKLYLIGGKLKEFVENKVQFFKVLGSNTTYLFSFILCLDNW